MAKLETYALSDQPLSFSDMLIGTDVHSLIPNATKNFSLGALYNLFAALPAVGNLQQTLNAGNTATQNITLTGNIQSTTIQPQSIIDMFGSTGTPLQVLQKQATGIAWVNSSGLQVQSDWNATTGIASILNKPTIPSISGLVPYMGATSDVNIGGYTYLADIGSYNSSLTGGALYITNAAATMYSQQQNNLFVITNVTAGTTMKMTSTGITYTDGSSQTTAFPPTGGTISQYIRGNGTLATFPTIPIVTPSALTKTDDTNVTLTLGGSPLTALLQGVSLTLGWTGTLADSRIESSATWNAKQNGLSGTGFVKISGTTISYDNSTYYLASNPSGYTTNLGTVTNISVVTANGISASIATSTTTPAITFTLGAITPTSTNGVSAATMAYNDATSSIQTQLNSKQGTLTLTTTGTSGASTLIANTLNIPQYTGGGGGTWGSITGNLPDQIDLQNTLNVISVSSRMFNFQNFR